ncbi:hypothetical protein POM88_043361 [Heracleum sosnowskyi]|uniref:FAR1 domain-containing protein n=1 Tax=Heracleum sosnowskyi TaxID=360622 RepID=A0AAD8H3E4_9APIA|nr:hypothetical protein POM88_043361 [Heracleum sosnowskyi]
MDSCSVRRSTQRSRKGVVVSKFFVCSKAGSRESTSSSREDDASESSRIFDKNVEPVKRRRTVSGKCDCSAKLALKFVGSESYNVSSFIDKHNHPFATDLQQILRSNFFVVIGL